MSRRIFKLFLSFVICITSCLTIITNDVSAKEEKLVKVNEENVERLVITTALDWVKMVEPDLDLIASDVVQIISPYSDEIEYSVSLFYNTIPYGYLVVGFYNYDVVVKEANVSIGQEGLYADIVDRIDEVTDEPRKKLDIEEKITRIAPLQYGLVYKSEDDAKYLLDNYGNRFSEYDESTKYDTPWCIYIDSCNWTSQEYQVNDSSKIILDKYLNRSALISEASVEEIAGKYACPVQALLQIAYMEGLTTYSYADVQNTYNTLWNYCKIVETDESKKNTSNDKVVYGGGTIENYVKGFIKFAQEKGYTDTVYKGIKANPSVAWLKDKLEYNRPIIMSYGINVDGKRSGHAISILGYMSARKVSSGNTWNYLMVYNGWDDTVSYLNYTCVDFMDCHASYFWVK